ncbi:MAG: T9SS type A sorting domain-containing protein, partial [Thermoanaerobaculia bacterium]|nr:T9SS type A sorting domain-containing protein [Thermoanaerobaculia bacterium]
LREDTNFLLEAQQRWKDLRAGPLSDQAAMAAVDSLVAVLDGGPRNRNFQRWPVLGIWLWPNNFVGNTYPEEVDYLKDWFLERLHWMDANVMGLYVGTYDPGTFFPPRITPNPARGTTRLEFHAPTGVRYSWALYDVSGKVFYRYYNSTQTPNFQSIDIDLPAAPGLYFLHLEADGKRTVQKIVVQ